MVETAVCVVSIWEGLPALVVADEVLEVSPTKEMAGSIVLVIAERAGEAVATEAIEESPTFTVPEEGTVVTTKVVDEAGMPVAITFAM